MNWSGTKIKLLLRQWTPACLGSDLSTFWSAVEEQFPKNSQLTKKFMFAVTNSADAGRSLSLYNLIVRGCRRSLSEFSIPHLVFLYYNTRTMSGGLEQDNCVEDKEELLPALREIYGLKMEQKVGIR